MERCAHLLVNDPELYKGCWLNSFGYSELRVEIGCGKGGFLAKAAAAQPDVLFVALEKSANVLVIALERAVDADLPNIRFVNMFAENLSSLFAPGEVSRIYINFCDPWPSNRHAKRRLTCQSFLEMYKQILNDSGQLYFKTDSLPLFEFSLREFERSDFSLIEVTRDLHKNGPVGIMTEYEQKFYAQSLPIFQCVAVLSAERTCSFK
ncbi:MAG: tRNA (guanosine(46)-N7)-methyltransferase TrmB [Oscillospiraceae bacterium]|nr:tRNA (guanosine(46)-N7)-methyltransferase TrmB [Oscillospiraceae bacterium]